MRFPILYLGVLGLFLFGCNSTKTISPDSNSSISEVADTNSGKPTSPQIVISFEQTACFGTCPVHKMTIYTTRHASYVGNRNVKYTGDFIADISNSQLLEIMNKANSSKFFALEDSYTANMTDLPTTIIYINDGSRKKKVIAYGNYPDNLKEFITYLYGFSQTVNWVSND